MNQQSDDLKRLAEARGDGMSTTEEHKHKYIAEKYTVQKYMHEYVTTGKYDNAILDIEIPYLFCTSCGDVKQIADSLDDKQ